MKKPRYQIKVPVDRTALRAIAARHGVTVPELVAAAAKRAVSAPISPAVPERVVRTTVSLPAALAAQAGRCTLDEAVRRAAADIRGYGRFRTNVPLRTHTAPVARVEVVADQRDLRLVRGAAIRRGTTLSRVVSAYYVSPSRDDGEASKR